MFTAFAERDYRAFWITQFISNVGWWMQVVAQGWLVYRLTDSAFLLGFVGFASSAPALVLMLPGGVLADQLDRKRVVILSQWAQAASAAWLAGAIWLDRIDVWQIIGAAVVVGIAQSFSAPAWQAMVVDLLDDRRNLPNAVAMNSLQFNSSRAVGPVLAGLALTAWGTAWCFLANALSFLPLILVLGRVRNRQQPVAGGPMFARLREGLTYVWNDRTAFLLLSIVAATSVFGFPFINLMPVVARTLFTNDASGNAWLMGATGVGTLAGALALSIRTPQRRLRFIVTTMLLFGLALVALGFFDRVVLVLVTLAVAGLTMVMSMAMCNTTIQQRIPDTMRGRVLSMYTFAFFAFVPFGNLMAGALAEHHGIDTAMIALGTGIIASSIVATLLLRSR
jgi:MFS family permease